MVGKEKAPVETWQIHQETFLMNLPLEERYNIEICKIRRLGNNKFAILLK